jgi:hypothetical protein
MRAGRDKHREQVRSKATTNDEEWFPSGQVYRRRCRSSCRQRIHKSTNKRPSFLGRREPFVRSSAKRCGRSCNCTRARVWNKARVHLSRLERGRLYPAVVCTIAYKSCGCNETERTTTTTTTMVDSGSYSDGVQKVGHGQEIHYYVLGRWWGQQQQLNYLHYRSFVRVDQPAISTSVRNVLCRTNLPSVCRHSKASGAGGD